RRLAVDQGIGKKALGGVVLEPGFAEATGIFRLGDALLVRMQLDIVADAAAKSAGGVFDYGKAHPDSHGIRPTGGSRPRLAGMFAVVVRTGRNHKRSAQFSTEATSSDTARLVAAGFDHFPGAC